MPVPVKLWISCINSKQYCEDPTLNPCINFVPKIHALQFQSVAQKKAWERWLVFLPIMWRRNTCGQPPSILQTRFNKFCTWKHVNPHSLKKLCMLYSHLWKKKKFRPKYWKQLKCNACAQEVVWDPKDPDEGAGDGASSNHRFFAPISSGKNQAILEGCWSRLRYWCQRRRRGRWPLLRWKASASTKPRWTGWWWCSTDIFVSQN